MLDYLVSFDNKHGYAPSFEEIGKGLKLTSLATVHKHITTLEKKGFIRRGYNQSRSIRNPAVAQASEGTDQRQEDSTSCRSWAASPQAGLSRPSRNVRHSLLVTSPAVVTPSSFRLKAAP